MQTFTLTIGWRRFLFFCWILFHVTFLTLVTLSLWINRHSHSSFSLLVERKRSVSFNEKWEGGMWFTCVYTYNQLSVEEKRRTRSLSLADKRTKKQSPLLLLDNYASQRDISYAYSSHSQSRGIPNLCIYLEHYDCFSTYSEI